MAEFQFKIPDVYRPGLIALIRLTDEQFSNLMNVLQGTKMGDTEVTLAAALAEKLDPGAGDVRVMAMMIVSVYRLLFESHVSAAQISAGLEIAFHALPAHGKTESHLKVKERFLAILSLESGLFYTIKSRILFEESNAVFEDCRIITDIRLTFDDHSIQEGYKGGMVVHNLRLAYREDKRVVNAILNCDKSDLEKLRAAIDRALEKEKWIREGNLGREISFIDKK